MSDDKKTTIRIIAENRKARHNYLIEDTFEAGICLSGTEVKAARDAKVNLVDAYAAFKGRELFLLNAHISPYSHGNLANHEPIRSRKLLLKYAELDKLWAKKEIRGYSLIPLKMYFKGGWAKIELAIAKGKKLHDKRQTEREKDAKRDMAQLQKMVRR